MSIIIGGCETQSKFPEYSGENQLGIESKRISEYGIYPTIEKYEGRSDYWYYKFGDVCSIVDSESNVGIIDNNRVYTHLGYVKGMESKYFEKKDVREVIYFATKFDPVSTNDLKLKQRAEGLMSRRLQIEADKIYELMLNHIDEDLGVIASSVGVNIILNRLAIPIDLITCNSVIDITDKLIESVNRGSTFYNNKIQFDQPTAQSLILALSLRKIMGVEYILVNQTKKEMVSFSHLNGSKMRELTGNAAQSAIVTWYLLNNQGDEIQFVSDTYGDWPFKTGSMKEAFNYPDKTEELVKVLIEKKILKDNGYLHQDDEDPNSIYIRDIINVWLS